MQGFNMGRYVPPDQEGIKTGNQLHRKKPPGQHGSTLTVRFEMPFNIFCTHCNGHIAQGVRFNAEKHKVGQYYSTPIWGFRMKHSVCGGVIEVRTDPKNTAYVVTEGGKKQNTGEGSSETGVIRVKPLPGEEDDGGVMGKLEKAAEEAKRKAIDEPRIEELRRLSERQWADPYEHSRRMRRIFRAERKRLQIQAAGAAAIQDRFGLSIPILEGSVEDEAGAKAIEFQPLEGGEEERIEEAMAGEMFESGGGVGVSGWSKNGGGNGMEGSRKRSSAGNEGKLSKMTKAEILAEQSRERLEKRLRRNTRLKMDPFLAGSWNRPSGGEKALDPPALKLKRKSPVVTTGAPDPSTGDNGGNASDGNCGEEKQDIGPHAREKPVVSTAPHKPTNLVGYGSDSD